MKKVFVSVCGFVLCGLFMGCGNPEIKMAVIPGGEFEISETEVPQKIYLKVMGKNPSMNQGDGNLPVEMVSWFDALVFCNRLSVIEGLRPVYSVDGETDVENWGYEPNCGAAFEKEILCDESADGYRLPTDEEWKSASAGNIDSTFAGGDSLDELGWYEDNSGDSTHPGAKKSPNGFGLYDMSGNVWEWVWKSFGKKRFAFGGSYSNEKNRCRVFENITCRAELQASNLGFRVAKSVK